MTTQTITREAAPASDSAVRLRLNPQLARNPILDGAWWPRSTNAIAELPPLIAALDGTRGEITHVLLNTAEWDLPQPHYATAGDRTLRLGWHKYQPAGLMTIITGFGGDRFDLLVIPPDATRESADNLLTAAADPTNQRRAPALLTGAARDRTDRCGDGQA